MMMFNMMSSLEPCLLASFLSGPMSAPQLIFSNQLTPSNTSRDSGSAQPTSPLVDPLCNTIDPSIAEANAKPTLKPNAPITSMETNYCDSVDHDLEFEVGRQCIEPKKNDMSHHDAPAGSSQRALVEIL